MAQSFLITSISRSLIPSSNMVAIGKRGCWSTTGNFELLRRLENIERDATHGHLSRKCGV